MVSFDGLFSNCCLGIKLNLSSWIIRRSCFLYLFRVPVSFPTPSQFPEPSTNPQRIPKEATHTELQDFLKSPHRLPEPTLVPPIHTYTHTYPTPHYTHHTTHTTHTHTTKQTHPTSHSCCTQPTSRTHAHNCTASHSDPQTHKSTHTLETIHLG